MGVAYITADVPKCRASPGKCPATSSPCHLILIRPPPLPSPVSHPKASAGALAPTKSKLTKSKTKPVAETESSSPEESDASSQLSDLRESDEEDVSDQDDEDFSPNMCDDALGDLLAQEVRDDKHTAVSFIYIYHYDHQTPSIIHRSSRKAASQQSRGSGDELDEFETEGTRSSPRPPPTSSDTEISAAADAANDAIVDVESGDSDADEFPETISRAQVPSPPLSTAFIDCSSCTQPASKKNRPHASRATSQAPVHEQQMQPKVCFTIFHIQSLNINVIRYLATRSSRREVAQHLHTIRIQRAASRRGDTSLSQITKLSPRDEGIFRTTNCSYD